jgi:hypothetical protein
LKGYSLPRQDMHFCSKLLSTECNLSCIEGGRLNKIQHYVYNDRILALETSARGNACAYFKPEGGVQRLKLSRTVPSSVF